MSGPGHRPVLPVIDLKYKLPHDATAVVVRGGTTLQVKVWANRGRLEPYDTPASTGDLLVKIIGWSAGALPTVNASDNWSRSITWNPAAQSFNFTVFPEETWGSQVFSFVTPSATTLAYLSVSIAGRNNNHDQYIAVDLCDGRTPARSETWGSIKHVYR